jgi:uncharacterized protein YyaL (SSP411 family)
MRLFVCLGLALNCATAVAAEPLAKPKGPANRLAKESSPYLLQHAHNPVDWYPWGPEALAKAKKEGKIIFLSIGYSSCHWCHVMERETFENAEIAKVMNEHFVCIKVDREERPDIDDVYMTALQVSGSNGGWPLSMFLTPDAKPIFGGTYFPPEDKKVSDEDTIPGFKSILARVNELHKDKKKELYEQADVIAERTVLQLDRNAKAVVVGKLDKEVIADAVSGFQFDPVHGGFGSKARGYEGTKFPRVAALEMLWRQSLKKENTELKKSVELTLEKMALGGIYDHLGGGFHRYSTERTWTVPHFEKMLYDNAQLVYLYANAHSNDPKPEYRRVIEETLEFVAREMAAPEGYFYSALDADSDGHEGTFYVWSEKELAELLGNTPEAKAFRKSYALEKSNFEGTSFILRLEKPLTDEEKGAFEPFKKKLFDTRAKRNRPFLDTKLITAWNGQMIAALAVAGEVLKDKKYTAAAVKASEFILKTMRDKDGRLLRIYSAPPGGKATAKGAAFLDDYAFFIKALILLHRATNDGRWLGEAEKLQALQDQNYADDKRGGFYTSAHDGEKLFARSKDSYDGAQPSGNGIAAWNLYQLSRYTKNEKYRARCEQCLRANHAVLRSNPTSVPVLVDVLDLVLNSGGLNEEAVVSKEGPKKPIESSDVVKLTFRNIANTDGLILFEVEFQIAEGWHIYANPVGNKTLLDSATQVEFLVDGKVVENPQITFPEPKRKKDLVTGDYNIYEGQAKVLWRYRTNENAKSISARIKVIACDDKNCLKPSTIKVDAQ